MNGPWGDLRGRCCAVGPAAILTCQVVIQHALAEVLALAIGVLAEAVIASVVVYYCRTYYNVVRGGVPGGRIKDKCYRMCYERMVAR